MRARYYDPAIGRFISEDSAKDGGNWYAYAGNNPVIYGDKDGRLFGLLDVLFEVVGEFAARNFEEHPVYSTLAVVGVGAASYYLATGQIMDVVNKFLDGPGGASIDQIRRLLHDIVPAEHTGFGSGVQNMFRSMLIHNVAFEFSMLEDL